MTLNVVTLIPALNAILNAVLFYMVLRSGSRPSGRLPFATFLLVNTIVAFSSFMFHTGLALPTIFWLQMVVGFGVATTAIALHLSLTFPQRKAKAAWILILAYVLLGVVLWLDFSGQFSTSAQLHPSGFVEIEWRPLVMVAHLYTLVAALSAVAITFVSYRREKEPLQRRRIVYVLVALLLVATAGPVNLLPGISGYPVDISLILISGLIISYAILRYRLLGLRLLVTRSAAYSIVVVATIAIASGIIISVKFVAQNTFEGIVLLGGVIAVLAIAIIAYQFGSKAENYLQRLYFGNGYLPRKDLERFTASMGRSIDLEYLAPKLLELTCKSVGATRGAIFLSDKLEKDEFRPHSQWGFGDAHIEQKSFRKNSPFMDRLSQFETALGQEDIGWLVNLYGAWQQESDILNYLGTDVIVPLKSGDELVGFITLAKPQLANAYEAEDLTLLEPIIYQAGSALKNAIAYSLSQKMTTLDGLTGLLNHRCFHERTREEVQRARRLGRPLTLVMIDIDIFHVYNEMFGHLAGDVALRDVARLIRENTRQMDIAFRYGGEEFAFLVPGIDAEHVYYVAERVRKKVESLPFEWKGSRGSLTVSLGVASLPAHSDDAEGLIFCADVALLQAKQRGGNNTCVWAPPQSAPLKGFDTELLVRDSYLSTVHALAAAIDARDPYTYGHSQNVARYCTALGEALGLSVERLSILRTAALLHDLGKISISDSILRKKGHLTQREREEVQKHPVFTETILGKVPQFEPVLSIIRHHHENFDGSGYPSGLSGPEVLFESHILRVADAYEAMLSKRSYRAAFTREETVTEIRKGAGTVFDPVVTQALCELVQRGVM